MSAIFQGVEFHLPSSLPPERRVELTRLLTNHGATTADSVFEATHVITNSETFEGWRDVDPEKVVRDLWVERSIAARRIQPPKYYSASRSKIFSGVIACSADLHISDEEVVSTGIMTHGGQWRMALTRDVTHLFAISSCSDKYATGMNYRDETHIKVLVPLWHDHSVLFGRSDLSTECYEWPDPVAMRPSFEVPSPTKQQQRNSTSPKKKVFFTTTAWDSDPSQAKVPISERNNVWGGRRILLSTSLELTGPRRQIVEDGIRNSSGVPVMYTSKRGDGTPNEELRLLKDCDILITRYRAGRVFFKAWDAAKPIGTLSWLLNVQVTGVFSSPLDQILHFPIPTGFVDGFDKHQISVTNYTGESRDYLKKLITLMGGNFTPSLSNKNTVLIAAQRSGTKTAKADEWSVSVVNHLWLEDCFLRWKSLTPALKQYITYPVGVDFASLLSERAVSNTMEEIKEIIDAEAEAAREAEDDKEEVEIVDENPRTPRDSQASADETEVEGGLMPALDVEMGFGDAWNEGPEDADMFNVEEQDERMSFGEDEQPRRTSTSKSPTRPKSATRKKRIQGLDTPSDSEVDPEIMKKVVRIQRPPSTPKKNVKAAPKSPARATPKSASKVAPKSLARPPQKQKSRDTDSEEEASEEEEPVLRPRKHLVRRASGPAALSPRHSPRKAPDSQSQRAPLPNELAPLDSDSELDDLPEQLAPPRPQPPGVGGIIKVPREKPTSAAPKSGKAKAAPPRKTATPTPPSSPLSAPPSAKPVRRMPTATVEVVMEHRPSSFSAKKPPPPRTSSISTISHLRASGASSASAPPRTRAVPRELSPASSTAMPEPPRAKRSAATQATQRLRDVVMPDVMNYQNEMRNNRGRKGRRLSGRVDTDDGGDEEEEERTTKRRKVDAGKRRASSDAESAAERPVKAKPRKSEVALRNGKPIKIMHTKVELSDKVLNALAQLGAKVTDRPRECTHLIVPGLVRTEKFLCALSAAPLILTTEWAVKSAEAGELLPEEDYLVSDPAGERKQGVTIADLFKRAKQHRGKLFKDHLFYITGSVKPPRMVEKIILDNGGQAITNQLPSLRILETHPNRHLISSSEDKALWQQIAAAGCPIYSSELILMGALRQEIDWESAAFRVEGSDTRTRSESV
ncbi:hypothetical protein DFH07DRAFT_1066876 [Mycena maculata]|uniref:BRCT domain-containing protein n=1 Tax=Mycena maculata TaxID=230809 RepID=A0AAD7MNF6_9AGAR|nr:hypothetical protein DFH07DRAFT_1066876 [Mycena maculata]